ncbi:MAG TPA: hypothetical protein VHB20_01045 [Verrucomicrobiae bacterium]|jgi:hypothetical protein|nr:hypothetical protein [Verrucomicrobiae bacterium]
MNAAPLIQNPETFEPPLSSPLSPPENLTADPWWVSLIPEREWAALAQALEAMHAANIDCLLGGSVGLAFYTHTLRQPQSFALYMLPGEALSALQALGGIGFAFDEAWRPAGPPWAYRATRDGVHLDIVFAMPNRRAEVDLLWFAQPPEMQAHGLHLKIVPAEEMIWEKAFVLRSDRCDWPDILNLLRAMGPRLDWPHIFHRMGDDLPLLRALLSIYDWVCPTGAAQVPATVRERLRLPPLSTEEAPQAQAIRIRLLDDRPWFTP